MAQTAAKTASINIRMDADLKQQFESFCADMGMSISTAVNIFAKKTVREARIPFEIGYGSPNAETLRAIRDARAGIGVHGPFASVKDLRESLDADD